MVYYCVPTFYSNIYYKNQPHVGKYTIYIPYMDPMGLVEVAVFFLLNPCDLPTFTLNMNQSCRQFNLKIKQSCRQIYQSHGSYGLYLFLTLGKLLRNWGLWIMMSLTQKYFWLVINLWTYDLYFPRHPNTFCLKVWLDLQNMPQTSKDTKPEEIFVDVKGLWFITFGSFLFWYCWWFRSQVYHLR